MKNILITIFTILIGQSLIGQEDSIKFDAVTVIKEFNAEIGNFNKIGIEPKLPIFDLKSRSYEYSVRAIPMKLDYEKPQIRPLALNIIVHSNGGTMIVSKSLDIRYVDGEPYFANGFTSKRMVKIDDPLVIELIENSTISIHKINWSTQAVLKPP